MTSSAARVGSIIGLYGVLGDACVFLFVDLLWADVFLNFFAAVCRAAAPTAYLR